MLTPLEREIGLNWNPADLARKSRVPKNLGTNGLKTWATDLNFAQITLPIIAWLNFLASNLRSYYPKWGQMPGFNSHLDMGGTRVTSYVCQHQMMVREVDKM
jgi:hypothetical protein